MPELLAVPTPLFDAVIEAGNEDDPLKELAARSTVLAVLLLMKMVPFGAADAAQGRVEVRAVSEGGGLTLSRSEPSEGSCSESSGEPAQCWRWRWREQN